LAISMVAPGRVELPTFGLGNRCSIHLSYGADANLPHYLTPFAKRDMRNSGKAVIATLGYALSFSGFALDRPMRD
jgi:hypothetical protein